MRRTLALSIVALSMVVLAGGCTAGVMDAPEGGLTDDAGRPPTMYPNGTRDAGATRKPYPIVLAHGLEGFKHLGPLNYYFGVADALKLDCHDPYTAQIDPYNSS